MGKSKTVIINLRIDDNDHDVISEIAKNEARSINNQYRLITGSWINNNTEFESSFIRKAVNKDDDSVDDKVKMVNLSLRLGEHDYKTISEMAAKEARSFNGQMRYVLSEFLLRNGFKSDLYGDVSKDNKEDEQLF